MRIIDKILGIFGIRGRESSKVLDKIWDSLDFGWEGRSIGRYDIPGMMRRTGMSMSVSGRR